MPVHASQLYARNVTELLREFVKDGALALDFDDEIIKRRLRHARRRGGQRRRQGGAGGEEDGMTSELEVGLYIFMLAGFLGYHIITRVPPLLHTPLMSATNAIAAISLVGSLVVAGSDYSDVPNGWVCTLLGFIAVTCSATNAFGGFLITDRMLRMFKTAEERARGTRRPVELQAFGIRAGPRRRRRGLLYATKPAGMAMGEYLRAHVAAEALRYCYIVSAAMFVLGLKGLSSPKWARSGMALAALGMFLAVVGTLFHPPHRAPTAGSRSAWRSAPWSAARWGSASR